MQLQRSLQASSVVVALAHDEVSVQHLVVGLGSSTASDWQATFVQSAVAVRIIHSVVGRRKLLDVALVRTANDWVRVSGDVLLVADVRLHIVVPCRVILFVHDLVAIRLRQTTLERFFVYPWCCAADGYYFLGYYHTVARVVVVLAVQLLFLLF